MNREQLEEKALADYRSHRGVVILASHLYGYNELDDSVELHLDPPMRCRVDRTPDDSILHWIDEWLDPYWYVTPLDKKDPILLGLRSFWTDGPSYNLHTGETDPPSWTVEPGIFRRFETLVRLALARKVRK